MWGAAAWLGGRMGSRGLLCSLLWLSAWGGAAAGEEGAYTCPSLPPAAAGALARGAMPSVDGRF
eukprot:scaffold142677_cov27-Tisochrysis_lutea.AAC.1